MGPEIVAHQAHDPRKADVWALGVTLFVSCAGFYPFTIAGASDWRFQQVG